MLLASDLIPNKYCQIPFKLSNKIMAQNRKHYTTSVKTIEDWWKNLRDKFVVKTQRSGADGEEVDETVENWIFYN